MRKCLGASSGFQPAVWARMYFMCGVSLPYKVWVDSCFHVWSAGGVEAASLIRFFNECVDNEKLQVVSQCFGINLRLLGGMILTNSFLSVTRRNDWQEPRPQAWRQQAIPEDCRIRPLRTRRPRLHMGDRQEPCINVAAAHGIKSAALPESSCCFDRCVSSGIHVVFVILLMSSH